MNAESMMWKWGGIAAAFFAIAAGAWIEHYTQSQISIKAMELGYVQVDGNWQPREPERLSDERP